MQVLLQPLARQPLSEEEFYQLGVETPRLRFAARLFKLLKRLKEGRAQERKVLEVEKVRQIPAVPGCELESHCTVSATTTAASRAA